MGPVCYKRHGFAQIGSYLVMQRDIYLLLLKKYLRMYCADLPTFENHME